VKSISFVLASATTRGSLAIRRPDFDKERSMDFQSVRFTEDHEWVRLEDGGNEVVVGITDFASGELGDIVFVELPEQGAAVTAFETMGTIEAVKTVADLYAPVTGTVTEVNAALENQPELVNSSPFEEGWFVRIKMSDGAQFESLMTHSAYQEMIGKD
jgi:glycine cleavage system H protein